MAEKIARGCEYKYNRQARLVEPPYEARIVIHDSDVPSSLFVEHGVSLDFGPGLKILRVALPDIDPLAVGYWMSIWGSLHLSVLIDKAANFHLFDEEVPRREGLEMPQNTMCVPEYLRRYELSPEEPNV